MNDLVVKNFNGKKVFNFVWNDKPCWLANDISDLFGYVDKGRPVFNCIRKEEFEKEIEYEVLVGEELKIFKEIFLEQLGDTKFASKVIIFYEEGLYGFLNYTEMPLGVEFRTWLRREVLPELRSKGYYILNNEISIEKDEEKKEVVHSKENRFEYERFSNEKLEAYRMALETAKLFDPILDKITKDSTYKFLYLKKIFADAGIEFPKYIEEERM